MKPIKLIFLIISLSLFQSLYSQEIKRLYRGEVGNIKSETISIKPSAATKAQEIKNTYMEYVSAINLNTSEAKKVKGSDLSYEEKVKKLKLFESEVKKYKIKYCEFVKSNNVKDLEAITLYEQYSKDI